jgi:hypothetical protein
LADRENAERPVTGKIAPGEIVAFLGPSLPLVQAQAILDATYLHPAAQGDILLAAHAFRPRAMILIDGQFEGRPAVRHKEILWAMAQGIAIIGAASMGALRAAELHQFGMIGVGSIYRWYRRWKLAPDDAVAVHSAPAELGFLPLTDALVDLQATFAQAARRGIISPQRRHGLTALARKMNFRDRSLKAVLRQAGCDEGETDRLLAGTVRKKSQDAALALRTAIGLVNSSKSQSASSFSITNTFIRDLEASGIDPALLDNYN